MAGERDAPMRTGAEVVVRTLEARGVDYVFGIPGAKIDAVFNALVDSPIRTVVCRHEQNAAFIAGGIGRMTGKAGVAIATSGPGVSNLVTGLATATSEGDPVVALGGAVAAADALKQIHQTMDSVSILKPVTKSSAAVGSPRSVSEVLNNAFRSAETGRAGAAFVSLPMDIMEAPAQSTLLSFPVKSGAGPADPDAIDAAAEAIQAAETPVVLLGLLASRPKDVASIRDFIEKADLPVVGTFQAAGAVGAQQLANFGGRVGQIANQPADHLLASADLVVTIGYDPIEYWPSLWNKGRSRRIIHVGIGPATLDEAYTPYIELTGEIGGTLRQLTPKLGPTKHSALVKSTLHDISARHARVMEEAARMNGSPIHPLRLICELEKVMADDVTLCLDMGSFHLWIARNLYSFRARQILISNGQQTLGVALPWAIAASLVRPHEKVISISGDGGFLFSAMELETAVRLKAHIVHLIWIDGAYDMVAVQEEAKYDRVSGTAFGPVDPVRYAQAFGATGLMIRTAEEIGPTLRQAMQAEGPVIIGVHVDYSDNHELFDLVDQKSIS